MAPALADIYEQTARATGYAEANRQLSRNHKRLTIGQQAANVFFLDADDEALCSFAKMKAIIFEDRLNDWMKIDIYHARNKAREFLSAYCLELPLDPKAEDCKEHILAALVRPQDAMWWRRQLRVKSKRTIEQLMREAGRVSAARGGYVSDFTVGRRNGQKIRNQRILEGMEATNQRGESFTLAELSEKNVSNPEKRRLELMTRISGFEEVAKSSGHVGLFLTLSCPSKYHAMKKAGGRCFRNPKYNGSTPRNAQAYLVGIWEKLRAQLSKQGIKTYGFRIAEPHHDGTPHWHLMLFIAPEDRDQFVNLFYDYALEEDGDEAGAAVHRCDVVDIDPAKGTAAGYIAKYIGKNINGACIESEIDDETGLFIEQTCNRVEAWATCWGIRQFQQIGGATVSVYRELRKVESEQVNDWQDMLPEAEKMTGDQRSEFDAIHDAADQGEWGQYTLFQGGAQVGRAEQKVRAWRDKTENSKPGKYESAVEKLCGLIQTGAEKLRGLFMGASPRTNPAAAKTVFTCWNLWSISRAARSAATRTCVNNCNPVGNHLYERRPPKPAWEPSPGMAIAT